MSGNYVLNEITHEKNAPKNNRNSTSRNFMSIIILNDSITLDCCIRKGIARFDRYDELNDYEVKRAREKSLGIVVARDDGLRLKIRGNRWGLKKTNCGRLAIGLLEEFYR
jgi:hypothetical protein